MACIIIRRRKGKNQHKLTHTMLIASEELQTKMHVHMKKKKNITLGKKVT
jgi:hypothetical protein